MAITTVKQGEEHVVSGITIGIGEPCDGDLGNWFCLSHQMMFLNALQKDGHLAGDGELAEEGDHLMMWMCNQHGPEQPERS